MQIYCWPNKNIKESELEKVQVRFLHTNSDTQRQLTPHSVVRPGRFSNKFEHCVCPASLQEKKRSKRTYTNFTIISLWGSFQRLKGNHICSPKADLAEF